MKLTPTQRKLELLRAVGAGRVYRSERCADLYQSYEQPLPDRTGHIGRRVKVTARIDKLSAEGLISIGPMRNVQRPWSLTDAGCEALEIPGRSLNAVLARLGYTTDPKSSTLGGKRILRDGVEVYDGIADDVWKWLRRTGQIPAE